MAHKPTPPPPESHASPHEIDSPVPRRSWARDRELAQRLLTFPTLAERLDYLLNNESQLWIRKSDQSPEVDPEAIAAAPRRASPYAQKPATLPKIADWVQARSGMSLTRGSLYNLRIGKNVTPRPAITRALGDFWRIDARLLDPTVPASSFTDLDPEPEADELNPLEQQTYELMNEVGLISVRPREVHNALQGSTDAETRQFLGVLKAMAKSRKSGQQEAT